MGVWKEEGGGKPHEGTPSPTKKRFWTPPVVWYALHPPSRITCLWSVFPVQKSKTQHTRSSCGGSGNLFFWRVGCPVRFPPPIRFAPPHIMAEREREREHFAPPPYSGQKKRERERTAKSRRGRNGPVPHLSHCWCVQSWDDCDFTVRVKIITGSLVTLGNLFPLNYRYRYRLETQMNLFKYHYRYRLGVRSHPFISIDSRLPS